MDLRNGRRVTIALLAAASVLVGCSDDSDESSGASGDGSADVGGGGDAGAGGACLLDDAQVDEIFGGDGSSAASESVDELASPNLVESPEGDFVIEEMLGEYSSVERCYYSRVGGDPDDPTSEGTTVHTLVAVVGDADEAADAAEVWADGGPEGTSWAPGVGVAAELDGGYVLVSSVGCYPADTLGAGGQPFCQYSEMGVNRDVLDAITGDEDG